MANEGGGENGGGEETTSSSSPKNRIKFLCSHGGRILPRPIDGQLKYIGGETRVIAIPRDITFSELMAKLSGQFERNKVLKYQLIPEDLDALVSVRSDEDLKHMIDEHDRHESKGTPKLRAYLFPSNPVVVEQNQLAAEQPHSVLEQRYVDALNGVVRTNFHSKLKPIKASHSNFNHISASAGSSPHCSSPEGQAFDHVAQNNGRIPPPIHKVQSSPTLYSCNNSQHYNSSLGSSHHHNHHYNPNHHQLHHNNHRYHLRQPPDPQKGIGSTERLVHPPTPNLSFRADNGRSQCRGQGLNYHGYPSSRYHRDYSGGCNSCGYYDECGVCGYTRIDRSGSLPRSPGKISWE